LSLTLSSEIGSCAAHAGAFFPQAVKCDPEEVRKNPETPANVRAGTILLCTRPLHYRGARFYNNGCNSWKGKNYDGPMTRIFTGKVGQHRNKHAQNTLIVGGLALAYLAMVSEFGYVVTLMQSGLVLREQFFNPTRFQKGLGTKFKAIFMAPPHEDPNDPIWANPLRLSNWRSGLPRYCSKLRYFPTYLT
jgi:hypothetical protein